MRRARCRMPLVMMYFLPSDGRITVHDKIQGAQNSQKYVSNVFGLSADKVRVISPFVGGAFGSGLQQ